MHNHHRAAGKHSVRGNSRDDPTPFVFHCRHTKGCEFATIKYPLLKQHEDYCTPAYVETGKRRQKPGAEVFKCTHPGCSYETTTSRKNLNQHVRSQHKWEPKACDDCDDGVIYQTATTFSKHLERVHSGRWPARCIFPGCPVTTEYGERQGLVRHLQVTHGLSSEEWAPYLPAIPEKQAWVEQRCVVPKCASKVLFKARYLMAAHMVSGPHKMDDKAAQELVDRDALTKKIVRKPLAKGPSNMSSKKRSGKQAAAAPSKENQGAEPTLKKPRAEKKN